MKRCYLRGVCIAVLSLIISLLAVGCSPAGTSNLQVVTSTSLIAQIVERVGDGTVDVVNIIPPAQCPGHFDVKPGDIQKLANANLFLLHGWQGEKFTQELIASANNPDLTIVKLDLVGNWMTPAVQQEATDMITAALSQVNSENSAAYRSSAVEYEDKVRAKEAELKTRLTGENIDQVNVMCADQLEGFIRWVGLNIIATYGRPDSLTVQVVTELVDKCREENVTLLIDNLQSGGGAAQAISEEVGCKRITLSNFPGGFEDTETWEKAIDHNIELILAAIE